MRQKGGTSIVCIGLAGGKWRMSGKISRLRLVVSGRSNDVYDGSKRTGTHVRERNARRHIHSLRKLHGFNGPPSSRSEGAPVLRRDSSATLQNGRPAPAWAT